MKFLLLPVFLTVGGWTRAQTTSPEEELRRVFPIEAARVLGQLNGWSGEIAAQDGKVIWRDLPGKFVRERDGVAGTEGVAFFREVFRKLAGDDWRPTGAPPDNARSAFWLGADLAMASREDGLAAIAKFLAEHPRIERAAEAARLAGAHVQASAPAEGQAFDPVLLARGAAWLVVAEARLREPLEAAWAPVLSLAGRKDEAVALWKASASKKMRSAAEKSWNLALGGSSDSAPAVPPPDFTDADKAWAYLRALDQPPSGADSPEDQVRRVRFWLKERQQAAGKFREAFPSDPRRWDAAIIAHEAALNLARFGERDAKPLSSEALDAILAAPDASMETKGDAAFFRAMIAGDGVSPRFPHTLPPFHRALSEFIAHYPRHPRAPTAAAIQLQLLDAVETAGVDNLLAKLAAHENPQIAAQAKARIEQRARIGELRKKPLELKFTASDGREVDAAKLRGKVVLLDFWASWCGPCVAEAPHVVATFEKLRDQGFEIVGINLDSDKTAMESVAKRLGMAWPQHFDGKGWGNEIAQRFGIRSIPSTWLFDKQGKLRETGLRGQELEARISNLLNEP